MTLTEKLEVFIQEKADAGMNIGNTTSTRIAQWYYMEIGVKPNDTFRAWINGVTSGHYPAYGSVTRAIRKCRELHPEWRKSSTRKAKDVKDVKTEVGYDG